MKNSYGLDVDYFRKKLKGVISSLDTMTPLEVARALASLTITADDLVLGEPEFQLSLSGLGADFRLPCEVRVAPATRFGIGVNMSSVIRSIKMREEFGSKFEFNREKVEGFWKQVGVIQGKASAESMLVELLTEQELGWLKRFADCSEDTDTHDLSKHKLKRLYQVGVLRSLGFGRNEITEFGERVLRLDNELSQTDEISEAIQ